jgi:hypothetical protein
VSKATDDRVFAAARLLKTNGFDDVIGILMRGHARTVRAGRAARRGKRGVHVRLGSERGPKAFLDAARIKELAE